jgi:outer membrane protein assembly factor BamD (BamD/ComL family)
VLDESPESPSLLFYQRVLSDLRAGNVEAARNALDSLPADSPVDAEQRWRAEWNLIHAMRAEGDNEGAFARLATLLSQGVAAAPPPSLRLRLMWLEAQLSIDAGQPAQTPERCDVIMEALDAVPPEVLGARQRETISSHTLLLKAQANLLLGRESSAVETLRQLRQMHPQSEAAHHSYLVEARYYAGLERLVEAQRLLLELADGYPESPQAPVALWEAALAAEQRGLDTTYREALGLLDRLVARYPQHYLVFHARLRQGDILRKLNDFNTAILVYETW